MLQWFIDEVKAKDKKGRYTNPKIKVNEMIKSAP